MGAKFDEIAKRLDRLEMNFNKMRFLGGFLAIFSALGSPARACGPEALGTSRTLAVNPVGGIEVGLKTYPQTLALSDHEVVLTFDDGPWPGTTPKILDALKAECVLATFFTIGRNASAHPALMRRELNEGHTLGHHSMTHPGVTLRGLSLAAAQAEVNRGIAADEMAAYGASGPEPRVAFFRYPGFADTPAMNDWLKVRGIAVFGTDIWASDWNAMSPQAELDLVMGRLNHEKRGVILFHDTKAQTAAMMPAFLQALKAGGYRIVHIVAGGGETKLRSAPEGWSSETERTLRNLKTGAGQM